MKVLKLLILCLIVTIVMAISWVIGNMVGNALTDSSAPPPPDAARAGIAFLEVCALNAVLIVLLLWATGRFKGVGKTVALMIFVFTIQFLLPQMETFFFASNIGISYAQASAILIAGALVALATVLSGVLIYSKLVGSGQLSLVIPNFQATVLPWLLLLILVGYPFLYLTFGYYVAWQSESLRVFYTSSSEMASFQHQVVEAFTNGIYLFQILRSLIWVVATIPVVIMLKGNFVRQYFVIGLLTALLPTSLLFIPNPYMPFDVAMTHFVETSTSNFVWGLAMTAVIKRIMNV